MGVLVVLSGWVFPFTTDSLIYVTTAERLVSFKGLTFANIFVQPPASDFLPAMLEPPGYPLLIALLKLIGINEYKAAVLIPRLIFIFLPYLFFLIFRRLASPTVAFIAAFTATFMFSTIKVSLVAWTDVPYLAFSLVSIIMAFRMVEKEGKAGVLFIFLAGLIAGYAFLIRYIGLTLIAAIAVALASSTLLKIISWKNLFRIFCFYGLGMALVVLPFIVRNQIVFGTIQPYQMPPSESPFIVNVHDFFQGLALMFFANRFFEIVIVLMMAGLVLSFCLGAREWIKRDKKIWICALILMAYLIFDSVFLIVYKSICYGPEEINERYLLQIGWILVGGLVYLLNIGLQKIKERQMFDLKAISGFLLMAFLLVQIFPAADFYYNQKKIKDLSKKIKHYVPLVRDLPKDVVIVTNVADITYYFARRNVRMLANYTPYGLVKILGAKRKFVVFLIKEKEFLSRSWYYPDVWKMPYGYTRRYSDEHVELLFPPEDY